MEINMGNVHVVSEGVACQTSGNVFETGVGNSYLLNQSHKSYAVFAGQE